MNARVRRRVVVQDDTDEKVEEKKYWRARAGETLWTLTLYFSLPLFSSFVRSFFRCSALSCFFSSLSSPCTVLPVIPGANHAVVPHFHYRIPRAVVRRPRSFMPRATRGDMFCVRFIRERSHEGNCTADLQGTIFCLSPFVRGLISIPTPPLTFHLLAISMDFPSSREYRSSSGKYGSSSVSFSSRFSFLPHLHAREDKFFVFSNLYSNT